MNKLTKLIKNNPIISFIILILATNWITEFPLQDYLARFIGYQPALMISITILQIGCFAALLYLSHKLKISDEYNLNLKKPVKCLWLTIPFLLLVAINLTEMKLNYITEKPLVFFLYTLAFMSTGFIEEILFRGIGFNLIYNKLGKNKKSFYLAVIISSIIFGASHITHLIDGTMPLLNFIDQAFYAAVIGVLFTALYLRCKSLLVPIIIHGIIDVTGDCEYLDIVSKSLYVKARIQPVVTFHHMLQSLIIFLPLLIWGLFIIRKAAPHDDEATKSSSLDAVNA